MKYILSLLIMAITFTAYSQCPSGSIGFHNQAQIDYFLTQYPNCTEIQGSVYIYGSASSPTTNLNGLQNITSIQGNFVMDYNLWMSDLSGLESLTYIGGNLDILDCNITNIDALSNLTEVGGRIRLFKSGFIDLSPLNNLTSIGTDFYYSGFGVYNGVIDLNPNITNIPGDLTLNFATNYADEDDEIMITGFNNLTSVGGKVEIRSYIVKDISGLSNLNTIGGDLVLNGVGLTDVNDLSQLTSIGGNFTINSCNSLINLDGFSNVSTIGGNYVAISYNDDLENISGLNQITSLNGNLSIDNNDALNDISGLNQLSSINGDLSVKYNNVLNNLIGLESLTTMNGELDITSNPTLTSINGISNIDISTITDLTIRYNSTLSICQELNICNYLYAGGSYTITQNDEGCNTYDDLILACNTTWKNTISGTVSVDAAGNNCASGSIDMTGLVVKATSGSIVYSTVVNEDGEYTLFVPEGNYSVNTSSDLDYYQFQSGATNVNFSGVGNEEIINFCATATQTVEDVEITIIPLNEPRPGFDASYIIKYINTGTETMNGSVSFTYDDSIISYTSSSEVVASHTNNILTWDYTNLTPFESRTIRVDFSIFPPPTVNLGDILTSTAAITPTTDYASENNQFSFTQTLIGSYDPNDKNILQGDTILLENIDKKLNYVIRFQNTGTASAINIKVIDELTAELDWGTFELVALSHSGHVQVSDNILEFVFDDINLPDSTSDEPNSHGYIAFTIKPKNDLVFADIIENTAAIYFDFNEPIITNTTSTFVDADNDSDTILDSIDNCLGLANTDQQDSDNDGVGDACDDEIEVNAPYTMGFDSENLDSYWRFYNESSSWTSSTVSNQNDVDNNGNTIRLYSASYSYDVMLIGPRLNNLSRDSSISFWMSEGGSTFTTVKYGFMTDPTDRSTFTSLGSINPPTSMTQYFMDLSNYEASHGRNFAILVTRKTVYIDDFEFSNPLSVAENQNKRFKVYPNPVSENLIISGNDIIKSISVHDIQGRLSKSIDVNNSLKEVNFDMSNVSKGIYFVKIETMLGVQTEKVIKK